METRDTRIEMIGHASLRACSGGKVLVTDPWWIDPVVPHGAGHFPPLVHDPATLARHTDAIYISHIHRDHFHAPTLERFSRDVPVFIAEHARKEFRDAVADCGFPVVECPFNEVVAVDGTDFEIVMLEHDYEENAAFDSSVVIRTPEYTLFDNNDCALSAEKYAWTRERFAIDYAFLGYSPASFYPICFELDADEKARALTASAERRYRDFIDAALRLRPAMAIPFASGMRFLEEGERWKNVAFNSAREAVRRLAPHGICGEILSPGDRIDARGEIVRRAATESVPEDVTEEVAAVEAFAREHRQQLAGLYPAELPARPGLVERFRDYLLERWRATGDRLPEVRRYVIAFEIGDEPCFVDFSRPAEAAFQRGIPARYDMCYRYPPAGLQRKLDGQIDWDELHFSRGVSVHQIRYAKEYFAMLRSEVLDLG